MFDGIFLGKLLGAGVQAKVFDLVYEDGSQTGKVLKIGHTDIGRSILLGSMASSMMSLQREWEIGMQLKAALEEEDGSLPGFTRTCDCMAIMKDEKHGALFRGMMMEKIRGWSVNKRIAEPTFHNIHYVREMLFQVFSALDRAQRQLGFNHADLGLRNVMEHYPKVSAELEAREKAENLRAISSNDLKSLELLSMREPGKDEAWSRPTQGPACSIPPPVRGYTVTSDGKYLPLGPHIEFKIIDYGVGEFNETLAQAAGGYTPEETFKKIDRVFSEKGIPVGEASKTGFMDLLDEDDDDLVRKIEKKGSAAWGLAPVQGNRYAVVDKKKMKKQNEAKKELDSSLTRTSVSRGPIEKMYRKFWERKGDVFHLLLGLAVLLDDRVWPKEDEKDVQLFISLVHHVTGVKMKAYFVSPDDPKRIKVMGRRWKEDDPDSMHRSIYGARVRVFNKFRKFRIMWSAHMSPFNSGLLAGEALVSPFFGGKGAPHAQLPVCVEAAFPFRPVNNI